jgi:hypothetical protein
VPLPQAQQALSVALNKVGELRHVQGELEEAAERYSQALELRRGLLAAAQRQACSQAGDGGGKGSEGSEATEGVCAAALDLAASCLKLAAARREGGQAALGQVRGFWFRCPPAITAAGKRF